ncbi:MAG: rhodanese-related sulfurtransferase [Myxococcota bacterium]|jgi:rhodanese-related sulfurtransferase
MYTPVDVQTAFKQLQEGAAYVDVRSVAEFRAGRPEGAVNIPLLDHNSVGMMVPNPEFIAQMQAQFPADTALLMGCKVGGRSAHACQMLAQHGYTNLSNVEGGFLAAGGWLDNGLPSTSEG